MAVSRRQHEKKLIQQVFGTDKGRELLAYLRNTHVDQFAFNSNETVEQAYHRMGQADLIRSFIRDIDNAESLSSIKLITN